MEQLLWLKVINFMSEELLQATYTVDTSSWKLWIWHHYFTIWVLKTIPILVVSSSSQSFVVIWIIKHGEKSDYAPEDSNWFQSV